MTDNMKKFCEEASRNEELRKRIMAIEEPSLSSAMAIAKEFGFDLSEDDFIEGEPDQSEKISLDELDAVTGGKKMTDINGDQCFCIVGGGKMGEDGDVCVCVVGGAKTGFGCPVAGWIHY